MPSGVTLATVKPIVPTVSVCEKERGVSVCPLVYSLTL